MKTKKLKSKERIKKMGETEKKENAHDTLEIIKKILDYNENAQKFVQLPSKVDKGKTEPKTEESIAEKTTLRKGIVAEIEKEEKNINNELFKNYFTNYQSPSGMYKKIRKTEGKKNEEKVYSIKEVLNKMKKKRLKGCLRIKNL